jgi:hypothetical protein
MKIPMEIQSALRNPAVKKAWVSEFPYMPGQCLNCGGAGIVVAFVATEGPFSSPAGPYLIRDGVRLSSKPEVINGKTKYWVGQTISVMCPECQNTLAPTSTTPSHTWSKPKLEEYTDR